MSSQKKPRVAIVSPFPKARDGIKEHTNALLSSLISDFEFEVWTAPGSVDLGNEFLTRNNIRVVPVQGRIVAQVLLRLFEPKVIFVQFSMASYGLWSFKLSNFANSLWRRTPLVIDLHEPVRDLEVTSWVGRWLYRKLIKSCEVCIVHTVEARTKVLEIDSRANVFLVPLLANLNNLQLRMLPDKLPNVDVVAPGFISRDKGTDLLVKAWQRHPGLRNRKLTVAGDPRKRSGIFRIFELIDFAFYAGLKFRAKNNPNIEFVTGLDDEEFGSILGGANLVALPYRRATQSGIMALAKSLSVPIISSNLQGLRNQNPGARFVDQNDWQSWGDAISTFRASSSHLTEKNLGKSHSENSLVVAAYANIFRRSLERFLG